MLAFYIVLLGIVVYRLLKVFYNLFFHPLARFPGPKLAAATHLYEFYWSVIRDGEFIWEIERLHKKYGEDPFLNVFVLFFILTFLKVRLSV